MRALNNEELQIQEVQLENVSDPLSKFNSLIHILKGHEEFTLSPSGFIVSSNLEVVNITGYEEWEVIGKHISLFYTDEEKEKALTDLDKATRLKEFTVTGLRLKRRSAPFWAKMRISAIYDNDNTTTGYKVILQDATHRALSNARVRTLKDEYLAIFNNPFVGSFKFKMSDYRLQICNQKTLEIIGRKDSSNLSFRDFFSSQLQFDHFASILEKEKRVDGFKFLVSDEKEQQNWAVISARYFEGNGFAEGVLFDISEQYTQTLELERLNSELDNFTYHASHDLRAPLTTIMGLINLSKVESAEKTPTYLGMIEERVKHLDIVLKDLATVTYNNTSTVESEEFNFRTEIDSLVSLIQKSNPEIQINTEFDQGSNYHTDSTRMRSILWNLIANALSYKRNSASSHLISIKVKIEETHAAIKLVDNGIGLDWNLKDRVWDMFFKSTNQSVGSGLGLYIVKSMVEKLKGKISFESTVENGTTFLLLIPNLYKKN
jgi:PAS domain S-box-containing protein